MTDSAPNNPAVRAAREVSDSATACGTASGRWPRDSVLPDYGDGGVFGLVKSFARFLDGAPWSFAPLTANDRVEVSPVVVFLLVDGLGDGFLRRHGGGSALAADRVMRLTSVFPSTTASAVTTMLTGLSPRTHGLNGWFVRDRRFGGVVAPLPLNDRQGRRLAVDQARLRAFFPYRTLFQRRKRAALAVMPAHIADSPFSRHHCRGAKILPYLDPAHFVDMVCAAARYLGRAGGGLVHAYYPDFDAVSHEFGAHSAEACAAFERVDTMYRAIVGALDDAATRVVVSADHGFIDSPEDQFIRLDAWPEVTDMFADPMWGERRAAFVELKPGAERVFTDWVGSALAGKARLLDASALLAAGLLGPGPRHMRLSERIGTHVLLMEPGWTVWDPRSGEEVHQMRGVHGGLSADEMWVPLIVRRGATDLA